MTQLQLQSNETPHFMDLDIHSERIRLIPISYRFADDILRELNPDITRYMTPNAPQALSEVTSFIDQSIEEMQAGNEFVSVIVDAFSEEFLGICTCSAKGNPDTPELGIWIKKSAHGKKLGLENISALVEWARANLCYQFLIYPVDRANIASRKIPEALGGQIIMRKPLDTQCGIPLDGVVYHIV